MEPVGHVETDVKDPPHYWDVSQAKGRLVIEEKYLDGLKGLKPGQYIFIIFQFHRSPRFSAGQVLQTPRNRNDKIGVFAISSPIRPNPLGLSVVKILAIEGRYIHVTGLDMVDGTPILDIKPYVGVKETAGTVPTR